MLVTGFIAVRIFGLDHLLRYLWLAGPMALVGLIDDMRALAARTKIFGQVVPALLIVTIGEPLHLVGHPLLAASLTIGLVLVISNAVNLLDNINGAASGIVALAAAALGIIGMTLGEFHAAMLAAVIVGACLGFVPFNFPRATIFMGDAGALTLGVLLAMLAIMVSNGAHGPSRWGVFIVLLVPVSDTCFVVASRCARRVNPFTTPGTDHVSHRLARRFGGRTNATLICWTMSACAGVTGIWMAMQGMER
jgi:UDP-GlcNAc:undecaprenyl-phosphate GlcNAc-1-phosphate transferase